MGGEFDAFLAELKLEQRPALEPFRGLDASQKDAAAFVKAVAPAAAEGLEKDEEAEPFIAEWIAALWTGKGRPPIARVITEARVQRSKLGMEKMDKKAFSGYWNFFAKLKIHDAMLNDVARTTAYRDAILGNAESIKGKIVMDFGAGTGLLGFFALMAGAKHVYAIEASSMAEVVREMAAANGFLDRMTIVNQMLQNVTHDVIPDKSVDVIISETLSHLIFNEKGCEGLFIARDRFLKPGGILMPDTATLHLAPWSDENVHTKHYAMPEIWKQKNFHGLDLTVLQERFEKERIRTSITDMADPKILVAPPHSKTWDFKTMTLEELELIQVECDWTPSRTAIVHGVIGWFTITLGGPNHTVELSTGPSDEWTHWNQGRISVREPIAVNKGQKFLGTFDMYNNDYMSYDVTLKMWLPGTDVARENIKCSLIDTNTEFSKCIRAYDRICGVPYDSPPNFVPEYVKPGYVKPGYKAFHPPPRVPNGTAAPATNGAVAQDPIMQFGSKYFVPAQGPQIDALKANSGKLALVTTHGGRQFMSPDGNDQKGVVEVVPGADGTTAQAMFYWAPRDVRMLA
jgi:histone-arginine methyltransferase CARM1